MNTRDERQRIYDPTSSLEIYDQANFEDYIPNLEQFVSSIVSFEVKSLRARAIPKDQTLGRCLVNRIFLSAIIDFYIRKFRFEIGVTPDTEKEFFRMLYDNVDPKRILLPVHIHRELINAIRCYSPHGLSTIRVPRSDPGIICSSSIYHTADASKYNHVYIPLEYECLPATIILARLLYLIKYRRELQPEMIPLDSLAVIKFLLFGNNSEREIRITSETDNPDIILQRLTSNVFLSDFPECTGEALAHSIDKMPSDTIPELKTLHKYTLPYFDSTRPLSAMTPPREWFTNNQMFEESNNFVTPDVSLVHFLPQSSIFGKLPLTMKDIPMSDKPQSHSSKTRLNTFNLWLAAIQSQ